MKQDRVFGLDVIRAVAVLLVLLSHTCVFVCSGKVYQVIFLYAGFLGVELFFVLSGFLIGTILIGLHSAGSLQTTRHLMDFWIRRWFRTLPNYYLILVIWLVLHYAIYDQFVFSQLRYLSDLVFSQNLINEHPGFFAVAWSLSIEEWFYLLFPIALLLSQKWLTIGSSRSVILSIVVFMVACSVARLVVAIYGSVHWDQLVRKCVPLRLDSIVVGVLAAWVKRYHSALWTRGARTGLVLGVVICAGWSPLLCQAAVLRQHTSLFLGTVLWTTVSVSLALLLPAADAVARGPRGLLCSSITRVSEISYSIYLSHTVVIALFVTTLPGLRGWTAFLLIWVSTLAVSNLQFTYFEKPMTALRDRFGTVRYREMGKAG